MQESNNKIFNHLKIHTQYSICEGDTSNLCGSLEFSENLSKSGTQPMIGTQILFNFKDEVGLLPLIAMTEIRYKKIVELSSKSYLNSSETLDTQCKLDHLIDKPEGVILLSGSINGLIGKLFNKGKFAEIEEIYKLIKKNYGDNFYIEIQRHNEQNDKSFENAFLLHNLHNWHHKIYINQFVIGCQIAFFVCACGLCVFPLMMAFITLNKTIRDSKGRVKDI